MDKTLKTVIKRGIKFFLVISVGVSLIVLVLTVEKKTAEAISRVRFTVLFLILLFWLLYILLDGLRLKFLTRAGGRELSLKRAIEVILTGYFLAAVTPFQTGGFPVQLFIMNKEGIGPGKGMAFLTFRGILIYTPIYITAPFLFLFFFSGGNNWILRVLFRYFAFLFIVMLLVLLIAFIKPELAEGLIQSLQKKSSGKIRNFLTFIIKEMEEFRRGFALFLLDDNWKHLLLAFFVSLLSLTFYLSLVPSILYGLGLDPRLPDSVLIQMLLMALLLFIPTPGAGGIAEAGGAALFALLTPKHLLGIFIILWRFFTFYLAAMIGGIITLKEL
jgi:hypothetical protein